jgi:hypothetical protein
MHLLSLLEDQSSHPQVPLCSTWLTQSPCVWSPWGNNSVLTSLQLRERKWFKLSMDFLINSSSIHLKFKFISSMFIQNHVVRNSYNLGKMKAKSIYWYVLVEREWLQIFHNLPIHWVLGMYSIRIPYVLFPHGMWLIKIHVFFSFERPNSSMKFLLRHCNVKW